MGLYHYNGQPGLTDAALYTNGTGTPTTLSKIIAVNATGGAVTITLSIHRSISGAVEVIADALSVPSVSALSLVEDRLLALEEIVIDPGDSLHGLAGAATSVTVIAFE